MIYENEFFENMFKIPKLTISSLILKTVFRFDNHDIYDIIYDNHDI